MGSAIDDIIAELEGVAAANGGIDIDGNIAADAFLAAITIDDRNARIVVYGIRKGIGGCYLGKFPIDLFIIVDKEIDIIGRDGIGLGKPYISISISKSAA